MRTSTITRQTAETDISVTLNLDGTGTYDNQTGVGFFDHMLDQLARHSLIDMTVRCTGDLHIDDHHTVEDVGIALGQALTAALGDKRGIVRYGACLLPMDDALVRTALDLSGRPYLVWECPKGARNEPLDCRVYATAAMRSLPRRGRLMAVERAKAVSAAPEMEKEAEQKALPAPPPPAVRQRGSSYLGTRR